MSSKKLEKTIQATGRPWQDAVKSRNGLLDYGRLIAVLGIVWFHAGAPGAQVAYGGLPFFLVLLALPSQSGLLVRAQRLLVPFMIWSAIYALVFTILAIKVGEDPFIWWRPYSVLSGSSRHLWFLPFAFVVALVAPLLRGRLAIALPLLAACLLVALGQTNAPLLYQWSFGLIPVLAGFAFQQNRSLGLLSLAASFLVLELFRPSSDNLVIAGGTAAAFLAMSFNLPATVASDWCARLSWWVYLCHILVMMRFRVMGLDGYELALATIFGALVTSVVIEVVVSRRRPGPVQGSTRPLP